MKQVWEYLSGKKTPIGASAGVVLTWAIAMGWVDGATAQMLAGLLTIWTGVAIGHRAAKRQ